jgi:hypothetical protein
VRYAQIFLIALLAPLTVAAFAQTRSPFIGVAEIKPGMRGYGLTVFRGSEPSRFEVSVIDVLHNFRPAQDLILVRTDHPELQKATTVAGMSGSPIYLDGRLAGAYSYGWSFGKEPVAGVTPIANMMAEIRRPIIPEIWKTIGADPRAALTQKRRGQIASASAAQGNGDSTLAVSSGAGGEAFGAAARIGAFGVLRRHAVRLGLLNPAAAPDHGQAGPRPLATPILMGGMESAAIQLLSDELSPFGLVALQAGGGGARKAASAQAAPPAFVNGGAIAVQLMRGDISATAIGTVTYVDGDRLVAFGHPMLDAGQIALPTSTARVLHVLASERQSFKIAEAVTPLGALVHDRLSTIVVDTKVVAETVPVTIRVHGVEGAPRQSWSVEVAAHRLLTPGLILAAITNALQATVSDRSDLVFTAKSRVAVARHGTTEVKDTAFTATGVTSSRALSDLRLFDLIDAAYANPFENTRVEKVEIDLGLRFGRDLVTVVDAMVAGDEVDPGKPVTLQVSLRPFEKPEYVRLFSVMIPESAAGEEIEIVLQPGHAVPIEQPKPRSLDDLIRTIQTTYPSTSLVVSLKRSARGLRMPGQVVRSLPGSALDALQLGNQSDTATPIPTYDRSVFPIGQVLTGSAQIKLTVRAVARNR